MKLSQRIENFLTKSEWVKCDLPEGKNRSAHIEHELKNETTLNPHSFRPFFFAPRFFNQILPLLILVIALSIFLYQFLR